MQVQYLEGWPVQAHLELLLQLWKDLDESNPRLSQQLVTRDVLICTPLFVINIFHSITLSPMAVKRRQK